MSLFEVPPHELPGRCPHSKPPLCVLAQEIPLVSPVIITVCFPSSPQAFSFHHRPPLFFLHLCVPPGFIAHPQYFPHSISHTNHGTWSLPSSNLYNVSFPNVSPQSFFFPRLISHLFSLSRNSRILLALVAVMLRFQLPKEHVDVDAWALVFMLLCCLRICIYTPCASVETAPHPYTPILEKGVYAASICNSIWFRQRMERFRENTTATPARTTSRFSVPPYVGQKYDACAYYTYSHPQIQGEAPPSSFIAKSPLE